MSDVCEGTGMVTIRGEQYDCPDCLSRELGQARGEIERLECVYESAVMGRKNFRQAYRESRATIQRLEGGIKKLLDEGCPRIGVDRANGRNMCVHGLYRWVDCVQCMDDALKALLEQQP